MKKTTILLILTFAAALVACMLCACSGSSASSSSSSVASSVSSSSKSTDKNPATTLHATVKVEGYEPFVIDLYPEYAPKTVENFCNLAKSGYYDGLKFYRIQDGFCMQGGTKGDNAAGNDPALTPVPGEFKGNNVDNPLADDFKRGTVAMARTNAPNSATSAFFITLSSGNDVSMSLNGQYAAFGLVDESGMRIVNSIVRSHLKYATGDMGAIENPDDMPVIEYITIEG